MTAPEKRCGKTVVLDILQSLTPRAIRTESVSTAATFRLIDNYRPTLLIDEADTFLKQNEDLRGALNAGHGKNGTHVRCVGDDHEVRIFRTFGPVAIAGIGKLPGTLADRSIPVLMRRAKPGETVTPFRPDRAEEEQRVCRMAARWAEDNFEVLSKQDPKIPNFMHHRMADNWRPLMAIADIAGGEWPERARKAAALAAQGQDQDDSARVQLLEDIHGIFVIRAVDRIRSADLVDELVMLEDRPWPEWRGGQQITTTGVARLLRDFGIRPKGIRFGDKTPKGYQVEDFKEAFEAYLPPDQTATPQHPNRTAGFDERGAATRSPIVADAFDLDATENHESCGVAAGDGVSVEEEDPGSEDLVEWTG